jgi:hypothetical protein
MSTTTFFYDGQIRRYLLQIVRLLSNFAVKYTDGTLVRIPVIYGDADRQVAHIINQNSENTVQSAPKIAIYMADLELDTSRLADSSHVGKVHVRERAYNEQTQSYENYQGNSYTVERLMPTPYKLTVKVDIWSTSIDQKLQILEQILMLFNPSLEIQTSDNYIDWTSLSVVDLTSVVLSSRSVPVGTAAEIDIATLTLATPIWISPPAKVKRLGVITNIISNIFTDKTDQYGDYIEGLGVDSSATYASPAGSPVASFSSATANYDIEVTGNSAKLLGFENQYPRWNNIVNKFSGVYTAGLSRIYLKIPSGNNVVGTFSLNPLDDSLLTINWDVDTYPTNTSVYSINRSSTTTFDAIIDPTRTGPRDSNLPKLKQGSRYLIVDKIGNSIKETFVSETKIQRINTNTLYKDVVDHKILVNGIEVGSGNARIPDDLNTGNYYILLDEFAPAGAEITYELYTNVDGPESWKNNDGSDFTANENDIIEWDGDKWNIVFNSLKAQDQIVYLSNIFTNTQYMWNGVHWSKSFEGIYRAGEWRLEL